MRRFSSYGPVDPEEHFCVRRESLVERCVGQLVGNPEKGGHYFTIWAPRQTGKTWLMRRAVGQVREHFGDEVLVGALSMQGVRLKNTASDDEFFEQVPDLMWEGFELDVEAPRTWADWKRMFHRTRGVFDRKVVLLIDEFDTLPGRSIDELVALFRDMYLKRPHFCLHSLALIGVRAVLGAKSERGSPFNVQRALQVPNLSEAEVNEMFDQYQEESGQSVDSDVRAAVFDATRGQPGLVSWFGELLTEKYNPGEKTSISLRDWERTFTLALSVEWNNTVLNLVKKAQSKAYSPYVVRLFSESELPFSLDKDWCNYLYLNGVIDYHLSEDGETTTAPTCRFSSPFVQRRLYNALTDDFFESRGPVLALEPGDFLDDVFSAEGLDLPALLERYKTYLTRLKTRNIDPWRGHPRRKTDLALPEAIGHFHLYAWLRDAIGHRSVISPEFPTGNGKVDLVVRHEAQLGVIEVKSFRDSYELRKSYAKTAKYARGIGLDTATLVVFMPVQDESVLERTSGETEVDGVRVVTVAIGWG